MEEDETMVPSGVVVPDGPYFLNVIIPWDHLTSKDHPSRFSEISQNFHFFHSQMKFCEFFVKSFERKFHLNFEKFSKIFFS